MLAGFAPFRRSTVAETIGAILHDDLPSLTSMVPVGAAVERIVRHCMEKTPEGRFQNARDLMFDLQNLPESTLAASSRIARLPSERIGIVALCSLRCRLPACSADLAGRQYDAGGRDPT